MSKITDRRAANATRWLTTLIAAHPILRQQAEDWAEGYGPGTDFEPGRPSGHGTPTETRALTTPSGAGLADQCTAAAADIQQWLRNGQRITTNALRLLPLDHPVAEMLARHAEARFNGAGECQACGDWVEGTDTRRLRRSLCPACHQRWYRAGKPEPLTTWATAEWHRRGLCGQRECAHAVTTTGNDKPAGHTTSDANGVPSASSGGELRPPAA